MHWIWTVSVNTWQLTLANVVESSQRDWIKGSWTVAGYARQKFPRESGLNLLSTNMYKKTCKGTCKERVRHLQNLQNNAQSQHKTSLTMHGSNAWVTNSKVLATPLAGSYRFKGPLKDYDTCGDLRCCLVLTCTTIPFVKFHTSMKPARTSIWPFKQDQSIRC